MSYSLFDPVGKLSGVGQKRAELYKKLGVTTISSLLELYPRTYIDLTSPVLIEKTELYKTQVIKAFVYKKTPEQRIRKGLSVFKVFVKDESGVLIITIFNSKYMYDALKENKEYYFVGKVAGNLVRREMASPSYFDADTDNLFIPIYPLTNGLTNKMVQTNVKQALQVWGDSLEDELPNSVRQKYNLCKKRYAIENIHFPKDDVALKEAQKRLVFEELLVFQMGVMLMRNSNRQKTAAVLKNTNVDEFISSLPFNLTNGQMDAINDGLSDLQKSVPMNRLLQGDVGSGKTMVAAALCYACYKNKFQSSVMAPTQILASQHYKTFSNVLTPLGVKVCLLTSGVKKAQKDEIKEKIKSGEYDVIIGTHSVIEEDVEFKNLGLVITDEQHRFGVSARAALSNKGKNPHTLVMSATPIPRTLALIIYGDLDISLITELPKGRQSIDTLVIDPPKRERALSFIKKNIDEGKQAYIVCPLIEESDQSDLLSTTEYINALKKTPLAGYKIASLNGRQKPLEKEQIMEAFYQNKINVLVSTTVVEVGVDVPNANIMMIENAERFGLSQLHQLRGRVGRGEYKSYCILVSERKTEDSKRRLLIMKENSDGFMIAKEDLKLRGPGDFFGFKQHGLPELKLADLYSDTAILEETKNVAREILSSGELEGESGRLLYKKVTELFNKSGQQALN